VFVIEDSEEEGNLKIQAGFCNDEVEENPVFEDLILRWFGEFTVEGKSYKSDEELTFDFPGIDKLALVPLRRSARFLNRLEDTLLRRRSGICRSYCRY
jgi:hypothetical protein